MKLPSRYIIDDNNNLLENPAHDIMIKYYFFTKQLLEKQIKLFENED